MSHGTRGISGASAGRGVKATATAAAGEALESDEFRLRTALKASALFGNVEVASTGDADRLLIAMVDYLPGTDAEQVQDYLGGIWNGQVRYRGWDAHAFLVEADHVEMQAATLHSSGRHFVSVHIIATTSAFESQGLPAGVRRKVPRRSLKGRRRKAVAVCTNHADEIGSVSAP